MQRTLVAAMLAALLIPAFGGSVDASGCPWAPGKYAGKWDKGGYVTTLWIRSISSDCVSAEVDYFNSAVPDAARRPEDAIRVPVKGGKISLGCGGNLPGTCTFTPEGEKVKAVYSGQSGGANWATMSRRH